MTKKSADSLCDEGGDTFSQEFQATRVIWNDGIENVSASVQNLTAQLNQFARDLYESPLGKRAQQHPVAAIGIASLALFVCKRLLRR
jgi:hypothetical protein